MQDYTTPPKLKPVIIIVLAVVLALIIGGAMAKFWIMPVVADNKVVDADVQNLMQQGSDQNLADAQKQLASANKTVAQTKAKWASFENRYFRVGPSRQVLDLSDPLKAEFQLSREQAELMGPSVYRWLNSGGNSASPISIPAAPIDPNAIPKDVIRIDLQGVKLSGTFRSIMNFLKSTYKAPRVITVNSIGLTAGGAQETTAGETSLDGTPVQRPQIGPIQTVTADMDLSIYVFPRNGKNAGKFTLPAGAQTGGGGGLAAPGGPSPLAGPSLGPQPMQPGAPGRGTPPPGGPPPG